jgi:V/A-type H+-transporting ATPase subunit K
MNRNVRRFIGLNVAFALVLGGFVAVGFFAAASDLFAAEGGDVPGAAVEQAKPALPAEVIVAAFWSAAAATGVSCVAAAIAVGMTGSAAIGAVAERPEIMGRTILFVVFGEGLAIYGLAIAFIILMKV